MGLEKAVVENAQEFRKECMQSFFPSEGYGPIPSFDRFQDDLEITVKKEPFGDFSNKWPKKITKTRCEGVIHGRTRHTHHREFPGV